MLPLASVVPQDGTIDNIFVAPSVHEAVGGLVLVTMLAAVVLTGRLAVAGRPLDLPARGSLVAAQLTLMAQALLGIKLLDQGLGVAQLYIHYVGGLIPLGLFLAAGWVAWRTPETRTRITAALTLLGLLSAAMAFFIGRAYVQGTL